MPSLVNNSILMDPLMYSLLLHKLVLVQVLVGVFLYVNCLIIFTFLKKEMFREDTRYILFAQTLFVDSAFLVICDLLLIFKHYQYRMHIIPCILICTAAALFTDCTPLTLVAMCLERYVAICMPLRHADISTKRTRFLGIIIIWGISSISPLFTFLAYLSVVPPSTLFSYDYCTMEVMYKEEWQAQTRFIILLILFIFMIFIVVFTYIKIMIAARAASSSKNKSTNKSRRTVMLHAFQLFLCIMPFICTYIEMAFWNNDFMVFINVKYSFFIIFYIVPRCLSPLIYGMRDEKFFLVLRHYAVWGFDNYLQTLLINYKKNIT
ncbi:odorant receptor 131-2-like [Hoplias malabaricus]|uniref:odorant receptor 131-2-like n=1 Tax=Hoplias malabaricus TaxID=27720 RepID=UPI0034626D2D